MPSILADIHVSTAYPTECVGSSTTLEEARPSVVKCWVQKYASGLGTPTVPCHGAAAVGARVGEFALVRLRSVGVIVQSRLFLGDIAMMHVRA